MNDQTNRGLPVTLRPFPRIKVRGPTTANESETKEICTLIAGLAEIDHPDIGYSPTLSGTAFAPIPMALRYGSGWSTDHQLQSNSSFKRLVELGPKSLPFLVQSLHDATKTKLEIKHATWLGHEIHANPVNDDEVCALRFADTKQEDAVDDPYTVRVGDVCFVAIGQITNRSYSAVRYKPSMIRVINSPVHDKKLASEVRAIWGTDPDAQKLLDFLLIDFHTDRGHSDKLDRSFGGYRPLGHLQAGAAMRLAYYFPNESIPIIAERLDGLNVTTDSKILSMTAINGFCASDVIEAIAWSSDPRLSTAILDVFTRARDEQCLLACLPAIGKENDDLVFGILTNRLLENISSDGEEEDQAALLKAVGQRFPERAEEVFSRYLASDNIVRRQAVCHALFEACGHLSIRLVGPFLADTRDAPMGCGREVLRDGKYAWRYDRICDMAAIAISLNFPEMTVEFSKQGEDLDKQIEKMRQKVAGMKADVACRTHEPEN